jgi:O-methyltransferase domain/Dimerisation domain
MITPDQELLRIATGFWASRALYVAAKLKLADGIRDAPETVEALAQQCDAHPKSLRRILRALASLGVFAEDESGRIVHTPLSLGLRSDAPDSMREFVVMLGEVESWQSWGEILHSVRTGESAFEKVFGTSIFQYLGHHTEAARNFDAAMAERSKVENAAILAAWEFPANASVVDIGGGSGSLLREIMLHTPSVDGTLFDLPQVIERARQAFATPELARRWRGVSGDFFADSLPSNAQIYLVKKVIHDWDDARVVEILSACARAMAPDSTLLIIEPVIAPGNAQSFAKMLDLFMMVWPGGLERTQPEHEALLASAGLKLRRSVPTHSALTILEINRETS